MEINEAFFRQLFEMARMDNDKRKIILSLIDPEILDFDIISKFVDSYFPEYSELARDLIFKIPKNKLNLNKLRSIHKKHLGPRALVEISCELMLMHFGDNLGYITLIQFQESDNEYVRNRAKELISLIPTAKFSYLKLFEMSVCSNPYLRDLVEELIAKAFPSKVNQKKLSEVAGYLNEFSLS